MTPQTDDNKDEPREAVVTARSAGRQVELSWVHYQAPDIAIFTGLYPRY